MLLWPNNKPTNTASAGPERAAPAHLLHVNAAGQQVGGDEHAGGAGAELAHDHVARVLHAATSDCTHVRAGQGRVEMLLRERQQCNTWPLQLAWQHVAAGCCACNRSLPQPAASAVQPQQQVLPPTWSMSPWVADTVWSRSRILSVSQSTCAGREGGATVAQ